MLNLDPDKHLNLHVMVSWCCKSWLVVMLAYVKLKRQFCNWPAKAHLFQVKLVRFNLILRGCST